MTSNKKNHLQVSRCCVLSYCPRCMWINIIYKSDGFNVSNWTFANHTGFDGTLLFVVTTCFIHTHLIAENLHLQFPFSDSVQKETWMPDGLCGFDLGWPVSVLHSSCVLDYIWVWAGDHTDWSWNRWRETHLACPAAAHSLDVKEIEALLYLAGKSR